MAGMPVLWGLKRAAGRAARCMVEGRGGHSPGDAAAHMAGMVHAYYALMIGLDQITRCDDGGGLGMALGWAKNNFVHPPGHLG